MSTNQGKHPSGHATSSNTATIHKDASASSSDESFDLSISRPHYYTPSRKIEPHRQATPSRMQDVQGYQKGSPSFPKDNPPRSSHHTPRGNMTPSTPSKKEPTTNAGTPASRNAAFKKALKEMESGNKPLFASSSKVRTAEISTPRPLVIIEDSSDDEYDVPTDIEPLSPTKATSNHARPALVTDSSEDSVKSLFSQLSITSSSSSIESQTTFSQPVFSDLPPSASKSSSARACIEDIFNSGSSQTQSQPAFAATPARTTSHPSHIHDAYSVESSPNITQRKRAQRVEQSQPVSGPDLTGKLAPASVLKFAESLFGTDLETAVIVHCDETQRLIDEYKIDWGTQWELARGVSTGAWTWEEARNNIEKFVGTNEMIAGKVQAIMRRQSSSSNTSINVWKELDREQAAIAEGKGRGLGLMGDWLGSSNWYGGQVQQIIRLGTDRGKYKIILEPMEKKRSHRFARYYGSRRFLQLRIPDELLMDENDKVKAFLTRKFVLCGRIFVPFHSKDGHLYMVETHENWNRESQHWCSDQTRIPFRDFINWHNPLIMEKNYNQVISKYVTRFALGLSTSVPVLEFQEQNIIFIDDITSSAWPVGQKNPPANMLMTDGCGLMNHSALHAISQYLNYESLPAGVQGRIDGSKGFWILHPTDKSEEPRIWIRTSQDKIKNSTFDRAHRIFDLVAPSRPSGPIGLSAQSILNTFSNAVPKEILVHLMEQGLENEIAPLLEWDKPYAMVFLWDAINKLGNVSGSRTQRLSLAVNRALGLQGRDWGHDSVSSNIADVHKDEEAATYTGRNKYSGGPLGLHEFAIELIQSGFHPASNSILHSKMKYIVKTTIDSIVSKYRIPIEESLGAFIVPDPLGVLKEGEIYYRFSRPRKDPRTSMLVHVLEGDILLGRYPIRLPSDMQKVKAVNVRELDKWPDVVIISTQGKRSIASLLADGDMDGDELIVIWDPTIVGPFENKPFTEPPTDFLTDNFTRDTETVEKFCLRANLASEREANKALQEVLIANLTADSVGLYSMMHENAVVRYGYGHKYSIRLAYIFATLLDSNKSGYRLKPGLLASDLQQFGNKLVAALHCSVNGNILDILKQAGQLKGDELTQRYEAIESKGIPDKDLCLPYDTAIDYALRASEKRVNIFHDEIQRIKAHVDVAHKIWLRDINSSKSTNESASKTPSKGKPKPSKKTDQDDRSLAAAHAYSERLVDICLTQNIEEIKASYAYKLSGSFAFNMAFQELCRIKSRASSGGYATSLRIFDEAKSFSSSFLRALNRCEEDLRA